jgi:hypothetical protein
MHGHDAPPDENVYGYRGGTNERVEEMNAEAPAISPPSEGPTWDELNVGLKVGPLVHVITPEMVRDFCDALPVEATVYEAHGTMPPTLLATDYIPLLRGHLELGWGLMARHELRILRPVAIGDTVTVSGEIIDKFVRKGRHYWTLRYGVSDPHGALCLENTVTCSVD